MDSSQPKRRDPPRFIRSLVALGIASCLFLVTLWIVSIFWSPYLYIDNHSRRTDTYNFFIIAAGCVLMFDEPRGARSVCSGTAHIIIGDAICGIGQIKRSPQWSALRCVGLVLPHFTPRQQSFLRQYRFPLWAGLIVLTVPTWIGWRRTRHRPHGSCRTCGYNLTGNTSGICPECGTQCLTPADGGRCEKPVQPAER